MVDPLPFVTHLRRRASRIGAATLCAITLAAPPARAADDAGEIAEIPMNGTWTVQTWTFRSGSPGASLELSWRRGHEHWGSRSFDLARNPLVSREQLEGKTSVVVHFAIRRDAGTFVCDGHVGNGSGAGLYALELDPGYAEKLAKRGIGRPDRDQQVRLALSDVSFEFLDELEKQRYPKPDLELLLNLCKHGVDRQYVEDMGALGYRFDSFDELLRARDHGVDPRYVQGMRDAGFARLTFDELLTARDHGVDLRFVQGMRELGYSDLSLPELVRARDHGVDPRYVLALRDSGYGKLGLEELIRTRDQGVDGRYIRDMAAAGYTKVTLADLVRARMHGVDARVAKRINAKLSEPAPLDRLIQIHARGGAD